MTAPLLALQAAAEPSDMGGIALGLGLFVIIGIVSVVGIIIRQIVINGRAQEASTRVSLSSHRLPPRSAIIPASTPPVAVLEPGASASGVTSPPTPGRSATPPQASPEAEAARPRSADPPQTKTRAERAATRGTRIFLSYRREDSAYVTDRINDCLTERFGRDAVFKDVDSIPLGQDFRKHLREAVGGCDVLLAVIGRDWFAVDPATGKRRIDDPRDFLRIEVESALERDIPVIPVLVQGAPVPDEQQLPESLRPLAYRNAQPVRPDPDFKNDLDRLMRGIETHLARS